MRKSYLFIGQFVQINLKLFLIVYLLFNSGVKAQNVAVTDNESYSANPSAMLDIYSTTKGMLVPRLDSLQRVSINSPATGLLVFDTSLNGFMYYNGSAWKSISQMNAGVGEGQALFAVVNNAGDTVFAVYNDGVKVTVDEGLKGKVGGFAVSGRTPAKLGEEVNYFHVTPDSTRIYINDTSSTKGTVGGFAVSGRTPAKVGEFDYLRVTPDSTRVYVNEGYTKGTVGGFAVSGRTPAKAKLHSYFLSTMDSTRVYVNDTSINKGTVGGFAVSGRTPAKGDPYKFMDITSKNYLIGQEAGMSISTGKYNSYMGYQAGKYTHEGSKNIFLGYQSGLKTDNGNENIFIGYQAGNQNLGGNLNTFLGTEAGYTNTGSDNTFIGYRAGKDHTTRGGNVYIGSNAGAEASNGMQNVYIGEKTGYKTTYGMKNVFVGYQAGYNNTGDAGDTLKGSFNVFLGYQAGLANTIGFNNTGIGTKALFANTTGLNNIAIGVLPLKNNTTGHTNIAIGNEVMEYNDTGFFNMAVGNWALRSNINGFNNVALGNISMYYNESGGKNTAVGSAALYKNVSGNSNTAIGEGALYLSVDTNNTAVGKNALSYLAHGSNNTAIGDFANVSNFIGTFNNSTAIGSRATVTGSNQVRMGNDDVTSLYCMGAYATTIATVPNVYVNSSGQIMRSTTSVPSGSGAIDKVAYWNSSGSLSYNTNLHWDNTNDRLGIGATAPSRPLHVSGTDEPAARFRRSTDGTLLEFVSGTTIEGDISITGTTTSYNAFTGSHYAKVPDGILKGHLMKLNGNNTYLNNNPESEIIYGTQLSNEINSQNILGAYLGMSDFNGANSPGLVMAVGNGVMWVVDNGENLEIGDYLISSSIPGHAMKDKGEFEIAFIIGRVAESVNWNRENMIIDGAKHKLISVFFENFKIINPNKNINVLQILEENNQLKSNYNDLKKEIELIKKQLNK